jgi:nitroreductase
LPVRADIRLPPPAEFGLPLEIRPMPEVLEFLARRRSASAVTLGEPGPTAGELDILLRLAARAPDHGKLAPWRFIIADGADKARLVARLEALAARRGDSALAGKLGKLRIPPLAVFVVSAPREAAIPEWEQVLSAGAVCAILLQAALAMGFGANWITDWYSYDAEATAIIGLAAGERVAGCILIGAPREPPLERERPAFADLVSRWRDDG